MFDCLGFSVLGLCAYDPNNPQSIYFSIGEAVAALTITLIIPQFIKPIYQFRLSCQSVRLKHIYVIVFLGAFCVLVATFLPNVNIPRGSILIYPVFWELTGGVLFLCALAVLAIIFLRPATVKHRAYPRFARAAANFLAHANKQNQSDFSKDLLHNIMKLIDTAQFEVRRERSAFFDFRYRREIEDAQYARSLLQLVAEPQFCETLVHRCPWDTAAMLRRISDKSKNSDAVKRFIQEIGRQAIICPSSMVAREIGYKGFCEAPVLSQALFENSFINMNYQPISGLEYGDFENIDQNKIDRLMHGLRSNLATVLKSGDYYWDRSLAEMADHLGSVASSAHRQVRANRDNNQAVFAINTGLKRLIEDTVKHLNVLDQKTYEGLYVDKVDRNGTDLEDISWRDFTLLDDLSESVLQVIYSFANDFEGYDDAFWSTALELTNNYFRRFGAQLDGMNPLQQRLALKLMAKVKDNMDGWYPAVTRVLLSVIGPYNDSTTKGENPNSAYSLLRRAFYSELMRFPDLYEKDPEKAADYLPPDIRYEADSATLIKICRGGEESSTELQTLSIEPVNFGAIRKRPTG